MDRIFTQEDYENSYRRVYSHRLRRGEDRVALRSGPHTPMISHKTIVRTEDDEHFLKLFDDPASVLTKKSRVQCGKHVYSFWKLYNGYIRWRCIRYATLKCKCVMHTSSDRLNLEMFFYDPDHCHPAEHMYPWPQRVIRSLVDNTGNVLVETSSFQHSASLSYDANHGDENIIRAPSPWESTSVSHQLISPTERTFLRPVPIALLIPPTHSASLSYDANHGDENIIRAPSPGESTAASHQLMSPTERMFLRPVPRAIPIPPTHSASLSYDANQTNPFYWPELPRAPITIISLNNDYCSINEIAIKITWFMSRKKSAENIVAYELLIEEVTELEGQETWKYVRTMNALPLPMTSVINEITYGKKYRIIVRAIDIFNRFGPSSKPKIITVT